MPSKFFPPPLPYRPQDPKSYSPGIALVGCGGITKHHLQAYVDAGYRVVAMCDLDIDHAKVQQEKYFPEAYVTNDFREILERTDIEVLDITTHTAQRPPLIEAGLSAGKHVLSQKPFVFDLDQGEALAAHAEKQGVLLAVNQNARWAPHFSYLREAIAAGILGEIGSAHFAVHFDHGWTKGTPFESIRHLILYDYAIHWFDMLTCVMGDRQPTRVFASFTRSSTQLVEAALFGQVLVEFDNAQATLVFDGFTQYSEWDTTFVVGSDATYRSEGVDENNQRVLLSNANGDWHPLLEGRWFNDGFHGAMGELLRAIEEKRQPVHSATNNLRSLALCFAAIESAETHKPVVPGTIRSLPTAAKG